MAGAMTIKVSAAIMAHPARAPFIPYLQSKLPIDTPVVWDQISSRWDTGRRSLLAYDPTATHHVVIQDDALLPNDLIPGLEQIIPYVPAGHPLCLYVGSSRPYVNVIRYFTGLADSQATPTSWLIMKHINWGVGLVFPTAQIPALVAHCDTRTVTQYDTRVSKWFEGDLGGNPRTVWCPWPSLVEHRDSPSLYADRDGVRHAYRFIGEDASALDFDPTGGQIRLPRAKP